MLILFNKPYGVICQFSPADGKPTLKDYIDIPNVYAAGRLDTDSEGLLLLTDDGALQHTIADPAHKLPKTYWAEVEGVATAAAIAPLRTDVSRVIAGWARTDNEIALSCVVKARKVNVGRHKFIRRFSKKFPKCCQPTIIQRVICPDRHYACLD